MMMKKKPSGSSNRSDVKKKNITHEDRCRDFKRNLTPLKAFGIGAMMLTAGMSGAEARPEPPGSALQRKDHYNTTDLPPTFNQQKFNNLSHSTALEFDPKAVTPELLEHLSKFMKNPEKFIQDNQKRDHPQSIQKREQRQMMRRLAEKARENPEVLESLRNLFEEMPGKESSKTDRRRLDAPPNFQCLDVSASRIATEGTVPVTDPPGTGYQAILEPYLTNNCGETITNTEFTITSIVGCPDGSSNTQTRTIAGLASINDGQTLENGISEVENGACIEKTNGVPVVTVLPTSFTLQMMALGEDALGRTLSSGTSNWKLI
jgi:hypothetical protein